MPELLGPTQPVPSRETPTVRISTPSPADTSIQNIVNPQVVSRPDQRTDRQDRGDSGGAGAARYESNFMTFVQRLRDNGSAAQTFMQLMQGTTVASGIRAGFAGELGALLEFMQMDEGELLSFLQNQLQSGARFSGALFQALRNAFNGSSDLLKNEILQFLRRFSDYSSTEHLEGKMLRTISDMQGAMPSRWGNQLTGLLEQLEKGMESGDRQGNLEMLRTKLFPLVSDYVSTTHDHGMARSLLSMLTLDVARYENGGEAGLLQSLRHLSALGILPEDLARMGDKELLEILNNTDFARAAGSNAFADRLAELMNKALQGQGGVNMQEAFHHIMNAILINESVYMPLQHMMLPLDWNGNLMFSEMWVDPDADREGPAREGEKRTLRLLIKMDIQSLGAFDVLLSTRGEDASLSVAAPRSVSAYGKQVSDALGAILTRNGYHTDTVTVMEMRRPVTVSEVFPKIFERSSGLNVKA